MIRSFPVPKQELERLTRIVGIEAELADVVRVRDRLPETMAGLQGNGWLCGRRTTDRCRRRRAGNMPGRRGGSSPNGAASPEIYAIQTLG